MMPAMMTWQQIVDSLGQESAGVVTRIEKTQIQHPCDAGLTQTFGLPLGQRASFRAQLTDGGTLCVEDFGSYYQASLERQAALIQKPAPPVTAGPVGMAVGLSALGALLGLALGQTERSTVAGALLGGAIGVGAAALATSDAGKGKAQFDFARELARLAASSADEPGTPAGKALPSRTSGTSRRRTPRNRK